jgi:hypothetical protein
MDVDMDIGTGAAQHAGEDEEFGETSQLRTDHDA